jgi:hypothetical protein
MDDPLALQIRHFCSAIRHQEQPFVTGREGLDTLKVESFLPFLEAGAELGAGHVVTAAYDPDRGHRSSAHS